MARLRYPVQIDDLVFLLKLMWINSDGSITYGGSASGSLQIGDVRAGVLVEINPSADQYLFFLHSLCSFHKKYITTIFLYLFFYFIFPPSFDLCDSKNIQ
jgi:hypothetical protein